MDFLQVCHFHDSRVPFWEKRVCRNVENTLRLTVKITWRTPDAKYLIKPMENGPILIASWLAIKIPYKTNGKWSDFDRKLACDQNTL